MLLERVNAVHWEWLVYVEMFVAGVAAGAYMVAALLEWGGRGNSPLARAAHGLAFPLVALAGLLLVVDLGRPERFWHMIVQSERLLPMLKPWSPISLGSWLLLLFGGLTFVSFVDFLIDRGSFALGGWHRGRTLHGGSAGRIWAALALLAAFSVAAYSGILLSATNIPVWGHSELIGAVYVATAVITGAAALVVIQTIRGLVDGDVVALAKTNTWLVVWWLALLVAFLGTLGDGLRFIASGIPLVGLIAALVLAGVVPLVLGFASGARSRSYLAPALSILVGGLLLRLAIVTGAQGVQ
jgi:protein NrfD